MITKYFKFFLSRSFGTIIDTIIIATLSSYVFSSYTGQYVITPMISFEFAVFTNFIFSYYWIWHNRTTNKNFSNFVKHFFAFNLSSILGFLVKMLFLLLFEKTFGWSPVLCNFAALTISGLVNFTLSECIVFKKRPIIIPIKKKFKIKGFNNGFIKR